MEVRWDLNIKNFANIGEAKISISPLMCFVGDNNSGKSYVMSLLWGLLTIGKEVFPTKTTDRKSYKPGEERLLSNIN